MRFLLHFGKGLVMPARGLLLRQFLCAYELQIIVQQFSLGSIHFPRHLGKRFDLCNSIAGVAVTEAIVGLFDLDAGLFPRVRKLLQIHHGVQWEVGSAAESFSG